MVSDPVVELNGMEMRTLSFRRELSERLGILIQV